MSKKFYISDWHYGHKNILAYDSRPFFTVEEMNEELIANWNNAVSPGDIVYILGDMFWCKEQDAIPIIKKLNGTKFLVKGNHDRVKSPEFRDCFAKIDEYMQVDDGDKKLILCHYPLLSFKNQTRDGWIHLYGHVHNSYESHMAEHHKDELCALYEKEIMMINVGAMMPYMSYTPRTLEEIMEGWNKYEKYRRERDPALQEEEISEIEE